MKTSSERASATLGAPPYKRQVVISIPGGAEFTPFSTSGELVVPEPNMAAGVSVTLKLLAFVALAALIVFIVQLIRFTVRFPRRPILDERNIRSLRRIAFGLGLYGLAGYLIDNIQLLWLHGHVALEGYRFTAVTLPSSLIVAAILLATAEILKLAGKLQREQDLTI